MTNKQIKIDLVFQANTQAATNNIQQLNNLLQQLSTKTTIGIDNGSISKAVMSVQQLQTALGQAVNVDTGKINLNKLNMSLKQSGLNLSQLSQNLQNLGPSGEQAFIKLANAMSSAETPMVQLNSKLKDFGVSLLNTVKWQLASNMIHGIQSALTGAINYAKDLNEALNDIRIVTGKSASEMAKFANIASKTAKELNSTVTEYSKAALIFYQQGLDGSAVEERTNTVIKLAQVTGESAEKISDQMTAIWNNFDDGSKSLEYYADVITKLGAETAASSDEIVQGLEKFAATAQTIGLSYEYASSSLATVVAETRQAPEVVGTAFKTLFARLQGLSLGETLEDGTNLTKYSEALSKVGVQIKDQYGELKNADDILKETAMRWEQLGQDQKVALAQTVGGMRQYNQFMSLMENWDKIELNVELAELSEGTLSQQQKIWSESWEAASKRVEQSTNELYDSILNDQLFIGLNDLWSSLIDGVTNFIDSVGGIVPIVGVLVALFSKQLFPIIQNGFTRLKNNISVLTGSATKQVEAMQNEMREELQNKISTTDSEALKQQYILSDKLIESRQELARASKNMSIADREAAERRMALIEQTANEIQSSLELQKNLENEIKLQEKLAVDKGIRKKAAENILDNEYQQNKNDYKNEDDYFQEKYGMSKKELAHNATTKKTYLTKKDLSKMDTETWEGSKEQIEIDEEIQKTEEKFGLTDASNKKKKKNKELNKLYNSRRKKEKTYEQRRKASQRTLEMQENLEQVSEDQVSVGMAEGFTSFENSNKHFSKFKRRAASVFNKQQSDTDSTENNTLSTSSSEQITPPTGSMEVDASLENLKKAHKLRAEFNMANKKATSIQKDLNVAAKNEADIRGKMQKLSKTSKEYRQLEKELQKNNKVLQNGKNKMIDLAKAMGMTEEEAKDLVEQLINIDKANGNTKINDKGFEDLKQGFTDAEQGAEELADNIQESLTNTDNADEIQKISDDYKTLADEEVKTAEATKNLTDEMNNSNGQEGYGKKISNISTSVMSIAGAASAAIGGLMALGEAFDSGNSPMENFITYAMTVISLLPIMGDLFELLAKKRKKASAESVKDDDKEQKSTFKTAAAKAFKGAVDAFGVFGVVLGGILAAAIIGGAIYALSVSNPGPSEDEQKEESLSNSVASLTEEYGKAKEAADNFKSSVSDYSDGIKSLGELEKGTAEYRKTLEDTNNKAKELIETYGLLSSDYSLDANGVITFNDGVLDSKQAELNAAANDSRIRLLNTEMALKTIQTKNKINNDETDFKDVNGNDVDFDEDEREKIAKFMQEYGRDSATGAMLAEEDLKKAIENGSLSEDLKEKLESQTNVALKSMVSWGESLTEASNANKQYAEEIMGIISDDIHADFLDQISKDKDGEIDTGKRDLNSKLLAQLDEHYAGDYVDLIQTGFKDFRDAVKEWDYEDNVLEDDELDALKKGFQTIYGDDVDYNAKLNEILNTSGINFEEDADEIDELYELMLEAQGYKNVTVEDNSGEIVVSYTNKDGNSQEFTSKNEDAYSDFWTYIESAVEKDYGAQKTEENQKLTEGMAKKIYNAGMSNSLGIDFSGVVKSAIVNDKKQSFDFSTLLSELSITDLEKFQNMTEDEFSKITGVTKDVLAGSVYEDQFSAFKEDFIKQLESDLNNVEKIDSSFSGRVKSLELDEEVYSQYRDSLAKTNKALQENRTLLNEVAISNMRLDRGVKDLADDWEDLSKSMSSGDLVTQAEAISKMEEPLKDILNLTDEDFSLLPDNFAQSHFKEIEDVVNGVPGAIQKLRKIANAEKILFNIGIELDADNTLPDKIEELNEQIINYDLSDIKVGAKIDDQEFIAACLNLINASKGTKEQIEQLFKGWGLKIAVEGKTGAFTIKSITKDESYLDYYTNKAASKSVLKESESSDPAEIVKLEDIVQRYKEINDQLEDISRNLDKINDKMDDAYGQARLDAMDEYITNLEKENKALEKKGKEIKSNISKDQQTVADAAAGVGMSVKFDKNGNIANATQIEKAWYARLASVATKDEQDEIQRQIDIWEDAQGDYEDSLNEFQDNEDAKRENRRKQQQQQYDKWSYKIELDVELDEGELALIDYYQEKLSDNIYGMTESAALTGEEINITLGNLADREKQYAELTNLYESGKISQAQYAEGLKELQEAELEDLNTLRERKKELEEYYRNTLSMASEEIDKYTARLERSTSVLEHYQTMLELTGQEQNYEAIGKILEGQQKTIENQYAASKKEYEMYKKQADEKYAAMQAARGTDNYENLKEDWEAAVELANNAQDRMNENAQKKAEIAVSIFENSLNQMYQRMESILTNGRSFDEINMKMEHQQSLQEEYLTTTNKIYETTKMMRNLQNEIDKTTNNVAKQKLKAFQQETKQLQEQGKLSKFELDIQQAKYDLLLAEIALEEAQNAKSTVRLQRDSEGNFGYVYTADQEKVSGAEQVVDDAKNALYNIQLEGANNYAQQSFQLQQEGLESLEELNEAYRAGDIASEEGYQRRRQEIIDFYTQKITDISNLYGIAVADDSRVAADAWSTNITNLVADADIWKSETTKYTSEVDQAFGTLNAELEKIAKEMGINLDNIEDNINDVTKESDKWSKELQDDVIPDLEDTIDEVDNLANELLKDLIPQIKDATKKGEGLAKEMYNVQLKLSRLAGEAENSANRAAIAAGSWREYWNAVNNTDGDTGTQPSAPKDPSPKTGSTSAMGMPGHDWRFKVGDYAMLGSSNTYAYDSYRTTELFNYGNYQNGLKIIGYDMIRGLYPMYKVKDTSGNVAWVDESKLVKPQRTITKFDTGGYTGEWGNEGKLATLHEKELVLNKEDTENFLASLELLHNIIKMIDINTSNSLISRLDSANLKTNKSNDVLEQHVTIEAVFPNVEDRYEIEEAFMNLTNEASQYINRKNN